MTEPNEPSPSNEPGATPTAAPAGAGDPPRPPDAPPATDWREPPWFPPRDRDRRERRSSLGAIVFGLVILAFGVYYFLDRTLGLALPPIRWGSLWPVILIVVGGLIVLRSIERR
jgi:hypothetical protein